MLAHDQSVPQILWQIDSESNVQRAITSSEQHVKGSVNDSTEQNVLALAFSASNILVNNTCDERKRHAASNAFAETELPSTNTVHFLKELIYYTNETTTARFFFTCTSAEKCIGFSYSLFS
jgi:hypothetical protein